MKFLVFTISLLSSMAFSQTDRSNSSWHNIVEVLPNYSQLNSSDPLIRVLRPFRGEFLRVSFSASCDLRFYQGITAYGRSYRLDNRLLLDIERTLEVNEHGASQFYYRIHPGPTTVTELGISATVGNPKKCSILVEQSLTGQDEEEAQDCYKYLDVQCTREFAPSACEARSLVNGAIVLRRVDGANPCRADAQLKYEMCRDEGMKPWSNYRIECHSLPQVDTDQ